MKTQQVHVTDVAALATKLAAVSGAAHANLVLVFGAPQVAEGGHGVCARSRRRARRPSLWGAARPGKLPTPVLPTTRWWSP
jgi:hypothetical protein